MVDLMKHLLTCSLTRSLTDSLTDSRMVAYLIEQEADRLKEVFGDPHVAQAITQEGDGVSDAVLGSERPGRLFLAVLAHKRPVRRRVVGIAKARQEVVLAVLLVDPERLPMAELLRASKGRWPHGEGQGGPSSQVKSREGPGGAVHVGRVGLVARAGSQGW